jgi:hypothetical protein
LNTGGRMIGGRILYTAQLGGCAIRWWVELH